MTATRTWRRTRAGGAAALLVACLAALAPGAASGASVGGSLSSRLADLASPGLRGAPRAEQARALSLPAAGPGSLVRDGGRVLAEASFEPGAPLATERLRDAGAEIVHVSHRYGVVTVAVRPADLAAVGAVAGVAHVGEVLEPTVRGPDCGGAVRSEGDIQLRSREARPAFAVDGTGVRVGILSDSFDRAPNPATRAANDVASGDLPGPGSPCGSADPVVSIDGDPVVSGTDEGRAMAQIVHDIAPGASISFASAFPTETAFADRIRGLHAAGARVIVDDVSYATEPFYQDGPIAAAIGEVTAAGAIYFSAAGNDNLIDASGRNIGSWEAPAFRDAEACPAELQAAADTTNCMDFDPGGGAGQSDPTFGLTVSPGATLRVALQWAEPWYGVDADLDLYLLDATEKPVEFEREGKIFLVGSAKDNIFEQRPVEFFGWRNESASPVQVQLAVNRCFGATCNPAADPAALPRLKLMLLQNGGGVTASEYPESAGGDLVGPTVHGHAGAQAAIAVAAVRHNNPTKPEDFSSRGPVLQLFGPVRGTSPAPPQPRSIAKPDLAASDYVVTTFFLRPTPSAPPPFRFRGTSAAAPHAAAVAALALQARPGMTPAQVRAVLAETARPVGSYGFDAVGHGLVNAYEAVNRVAPGPSLTVTESPPALSRIRRPTFRFVADRPVVFTCELDGVAQPCASPFTAPRELGDGQHGFVVHATDLGGRVAVSGLLSFAVDTRRPRVFFRKKPRKLIRTRRAQVRRVLRFGSNEAGVTFVCKVDRDLPRFCRPRIKRRFDIGRHVIRVRAKDAAGNVSARAAVYRFRVKRVGGR